MVLFYYLNIKYYDVFILFLVAEQVFVEQEKLILELKKTADMLNSKMAENLKSITWKANHYKMCNN